MVLLVLALDRFLNLFLFAFVSTHISQLTDKVIGFGLGPYSLAPFEARDFQGNWLGSQLVQLSTPV